jgi:hypothetical protein
MSSKQPEITTRTARRTRVRRVLVAILTVVLLAALVVAVGTIVYAATREDTVVPGASGHSWDARGAPGLLDDFREARGR